MIQCGLEAKEVMKMQMLGILLSDWVPIGPEWRTETVFQVLELLKGERIRFKMPFSDMFFTSVFHLPNKDKRWSILVRRHDWERVVTLLAQEGLISREMLMGDEN